MTTFDRHVIGALVRHHQIPPGALGAPFYDIPPDPAYVQQVAQWHQAQPAPSKLSPQALAVLAAPDLVADIRSLTGRDSMIHTWALSRHDLQPGPVLLIAPKGEGAKQLQVQTIASREELADTMLLWLVSHGTPAEPEMHIQMSHPELAVLLAFVDLYSRAKYSAYVAHRKQESSFPYQYIVQAYQEAINARDPRWLLGFSMSMLDEAALRLDNDGLWRCVQLLAQRKLIEASGQEWRFTLPGEYLAESLHRRTVSLAIEVAGASPQGGLGTHAMMLVRSDDPLWLIDLPPNDKAALCGVSVQAAREVLDLILTPKGKAPAPQAARPPAPQGHPAPAPPQANVPPHPGQRFPAAAPPHQAPPHQAPPHQAQSPQAQSPQAQPVCPVCRHPVTPNTVFCGNCGARLR
jgi:hypothetical protein